MADDAIINAAAQTVEDGQTGPLGDHLPDLDPDPAGVPSAPPRTSPQTSSSVARRYVGNPAVARRASGHSAVSPPGRRTRGRGPT